MTGRSWTTHDIPDQTGTLAVITGANSGIGYETAQALAARNADTARRLWELSVEATGVDYGALKQLA